MCTTVRLSDNVPTSSKRPRRCPAINWLTFCCAAALTSMHTLNSLGNQTCVENAPDLECRLCVLQVQGKHYEQDTRASHLTRPHPYPKSLPTTKPNPNPYRRNQAAASGAPRPPPARFVARLLSAPKFRPVVLELLDPRFPADVRGTADAALRVAEMGPAAAFGPPAPTGMLLIAVNNRR